jgi:hypothetical protein
MADESIDPYKRDEKGRLLPGHPGGPGRPKGKTIKEMVREYLENNPASMEEFVKHFVEKNRDLAWQMMEGRPAQATDITSGGETLPPVLVKFIDATTPNNRDTTGIQETV